ncbi:hypothetical protein DVH05_004849 [Phytophthora capsici]|nr:hypothetical protein DVH05_004849 [Phytophthora capsici]
MQDEAANAVTGSCLGGRTGGVFYGGSGDTQQTATALFQDLTQFVEREQQAYTKTLAARRRLLSYHRERNLTGVRKALAGVGLSLPKSPVSPSLVDGQRKYWIDLKKQRVFSSFLRKKPNATPQVE